MSTDASKTLGAQLFEIAAAVGSGHIVVDKPDGIQIQRLCECGISLNITMDLENYLGVKRAAERSFWNVLSRWKCQIINSLTTTMQ